MTTTDIGILLIVLCILLWAIMAALHRHTVQMEALKKQMQELLEAQQASEARAREVAPATRQRPRDDLETETVHAQAGTAPFKARRSSRD